MDVKLSPALERRIAEHVARQGQYASTDAFVEQAVEALLDVEDEDLEVIRRRIESADREIEAGEFVEYDAASIGELARDVHERGVKRLRGR